jgi:hypothetical protein
MTGVAIGSATASTYVLQAADAGEKLYCEVTATNANGSTMKQSNATGAIAAAPSQTTVLDSASKGAAIVLSNGDTTATKSSGGGWQSARADNGKTSGKVYGEFEITQIGSDASLMLMGFASLSDWDGSSFMANNVGWVRAAHDSGAAVGGATGTYNASGEPSDYTLIAGDVVGFAFDFDAGKGWMSVNGVFGGDPAGGTGPVFSSIPNTRTWTLGLSLNDSSGTVGASLHTASSTQAYSPPSGFSTWDGI